MYFFFILRPNIRNELNSIWSSLPYEYTTNARNTLYIATIVDWTTRHRQQTGNKTEADSDSFTVLFL